MALSLGAALAAGCATGGALGDLKAFTATDFAQAAQEGRVAREVGRLPVGDRWPECFAEIAERLQTTEPPADEANRPGLATLVMRAHIAKAKSAEPISAECAQVVLQLQRDGIKLGAAFFPGGGLGGFLPKLLPR
ncbi:MAG TPA: hypothetical protein DCQ64_06315 [Candidatus Rokubacteria bacterium]|nr:hypothetical protein [Candidatus Rokubacteria bacterium]